MYKENIKVALVNGHKDVMIDFWDKIHKTLSSKYNMDIQYIHKNNNEIYTLLIDELEKNKYDLLIGDFFITEKNYKKADFTFPFFFMAPMIAFEPNNKDEIDYLLYIKYLLRGWFYPLIALILFGIIWGIILYSNDKKISFVSKIYHTISAFLGEPSNLVSHTSSHNIFSMVITIIVLICVFLFTIYFNSITVVRSISYFKESTKLEKSVKGFRIFINTLIPGGHQTYNSLKNHGAIPVLIKNKDLVNVEDLIKYYLQNKDKADGIVLTGLEVTEKIRNKGLILSKFPLNSSLPLAIPINKKKKKLLEELNKFILKNKDNGHFMDICTKSILSNDSMSAYC